MNILCLMGLFPKEYEDEILKDSLSGIQNAANKLQWAIVDGLNRQEAISLEILNSLYIGAYPHKYKTMRIPSFTFDISGEASGENIGFLNLPIIKCWSKYRSLKFKIDQWIEGKDGEKVIIAYALTSPFVELLHYVKVKYPDVKCVLFVPDLPEYMDVTNTSRLYRLLKNRHISHLKKYINEIDGYIFLTHYMKEWFAYNVHYTVVEGIYGGDNVLNVDNSAKEKVILYAGGLCEEYGIMELVESFRRVRLCDWKLELIGDGPLFPKLKQLYDNENWISIRGIVANSDVLKRQRQVAALVNPRKGNQIFTKYSFPSKTIEYMASGTPMIGYRLEGIPDEYYQYIYEVSNNEDGLANCLSMVMNHSEQDRLQMGIRARSFILKEKNAAKQCAKIIKMIKDIH